MANALQITSVSIAAAVVVVGMLLYIADRKNRQQRREGREYAQEMVQQRRQRAVEQNLPPFYIDHARDPIYVYEEGLDTLSDTSSIITITDGDRRHSIARSEGASTVAAADTPSSLENSNTAAIRSTTTRPIQAHRRSAWSMLSSRVVVAPSSVVMEPEASDLLPPPPSYDTLNRPIGNPSLPAVPEQQALAESQSMTSVTRPRLSAVEEGCSIPHAILGTPQLIPTTPTLLPVPEGGASVQRSTEQSAPTLVPRYSTEFPS